jgi:chitodextrinase
MSLISLSGLSYTDGQVVASTPYSYRVQAADTAGNLGPYSNVASATTPSGSGGAGLVAGYALNEGAGTSTADISNNHITGTLIGGAGWGVGEYGNAVALSGSGQYIDLGNPTALQLTGSTTVSAWINAAAFPSDDAAVVSKRGSNGYQFDTTVDTGTRTVSFKLTSSSGNDMSQYGATALQTGRWYFVTGVYDAAARTINVYLDAQLDNGGGVGTVTATQQNSTQNVSIGRRTGSAGFEFNGRIDEVRIYNRALSQSEIQADMNVALAIVAGDPTPPTTPSNLAATSISPTQVGLSWTASSDNVAVTHYLVERCTGSGCSAFTQVADVSGTSYSDTQLATLTSYNYRVRAGDAAGNRSGYSNTLAVTTTDFAPPTVSVTSPASGATLSGSINVAVSASGSQGVAGAQLLIDGLPVALPDTSSPYSLPLNTAMFANGAHTLGAYAWSSGNTIGYAPAIAVTFSNASPGNPAHDGIFSGALPLPIVSVHSHLLPNGSILMSSGQGLGPEAHIWNPMTGLQHEVDAPVNIFCAGHDQMADGRIFVAGGHVSGHTGLTAANIFDPVLNTWTVLPDMQSPRWYPTVTALPDGRMFVLGGETSCDGCEAEIPEIYSPVTNTWTELTAAQFSFPYYPHVFVLPDGRLFVPSTAEDPIVSQVLDLNTSTWTAVGGPAVDGGSATQYLPNKFMKWGTSTDPDNSVRDSMATAYVIDMSQPSPTWRQISSMARPRTYHSPTILPDGTVLITGGGPTTAPTDTSHATLVTELWTPATETFTTLGSMNVPRLYHSEAILLPDARVAVLGSGLWDSGSMPTDQLSAELYLPPYLFKGPRPTITSAPTTLQYGQNFSVQTPDATRVASVALLRFASVTHSVNMGQRYVPLTFFTAGAGTLTVSAPANANLATHGNYMLFLVDTNGVPSVAAITRL